MTAASIYGPLTGRASGGLCPSAGGRGTPAPWVSYSQAGPNGPLAAPWGLPARNRRTTAAGGGVRSGICGFGGRESAGGVCGIVFGCVGERRKPPVPAGAQDDPSGVTAFSRRGGLPAAGAEERAVPGCRVSGTCLDRTWVCGCDRRRCARGPGGGLPAGGRKSREGPLAESSPPVSRFAPTITLPLLLLWHYPRDTGGALSGLEPLAKRPTPLRNTPLEARTARLALSRPLRDAPQGPARGQAPTCMPGLSNGCPAGHSLVCKIAQRFHQYPTRPSIPRIAAPCAKEGPKGYIECWSEVSGLMEHERFRG